MIVIICQENLDRVNSETYLEMPTTAAAVSNTQPQVSSAGLAGIHHCVTGAMAASTKSSSHSAVYGPANGHSTCNGFVNGNSRNSPISPNNTNSSITKASSSSCTNTTQTNYCNTNSQGGHRSSSMLHQMSTSTSPEKALHFQ